MYIRADVNAPIRHEHGVKAYPKNIVRIFMNFEKISTLYTLQGILLGVEIVNPCILKLPAEQKAGGQKREKCEGRSTGSGRNW